VNEIGEMGIDDQLMRQLEFDVWELVNGCICCTLSADLVSTLQKLDADYDVELVIVEASGAADPANVLSAMPYYRGAPLASIRCLVLIDPLRLADLIEVLTPLITSQIKQADIILVSKADLASVEEIAFAQDTVAALNAQARVFAASVKSGLDSSLIAEILP
jgi:G3E family GTPase